MFRDWEVEDEKRIYFWGGIFSNWAKANFTAQLVKGGAEYAFTSSEQYMMAAKAITFDDAEAFRQIMATNDCQKQKAIGRSIENYSDEVWFPIARNLVYIAVYAKFTSSNSLAQVLVSTLNKWIVEASKFDTVWGIGIAPNDSDNADPKNWRGTNWLGQVIMKVRDDIINGENNSFTDIDWTPYENERNNK